MVTWDPKSATLHSSLYRGHFDVATLQCRFASAALSLPLCRCCFIISAALWPWPLFRRCRVVLPGFSAGTALPRSICRCHFFMVIIGSATLPVLHCRGYFTRAVLSMPLCRYHFADATLPVTLCQCCLAGAPLLGLSDVAALPVPPYRYHIAKSDISVPLCRCYFASANLLVPLCWCQFSSGALQVLLCQCWSTGASATVPPS